MNPPTTFILDGIWSRCGRWQPLRDLIASTIGPCEIYPYDTSGRTSLETVSRHFGAYLAEFNRPFHLVGYSMGGLVIRETIRQSPSLPLRRAAFLHSPHGGSLLAWLRPDLSACREMRPGSKFLRRLEEWHWTYPSMATWSAGDLMVFPGHSACWPRASVVLQSPVPAHAWPVISPSIHASIVSFLAPDGSR